MARSQRLFRKKYNEAVDFLAAGGAVESISGFARSLSMSRTTGRLVLSKLNEQGLLRESAGRAARSITRRDYFPENEVIETGEVLRRAFMQWIIRKRFWEGAVLDERKIAAELRIPMSAVHEFLIGLARFGFLRKDRRREWVVESFGEVFTRELLSVRQLFECNSIAPLVALPETDPFWAALHRIREDHLNLMPRVAGDTLGFIELDNRFHTLLNSAADNRFMQVFQDAIFFLFYYHYRWNSSVESNRNRVALDEHLRVIEALLARDGETARQAFWSHLQKSQNNLLESLDGRRR